MSTYSISELHLFRTFTTRDEYRRVTGMDAPPYDPTRPPKAWFDPKAASSARKTVIYDPVLATTPDGTPMAGPDGRPMLDVLPIDREFAANVNIWHDQSGQPMPMMAPVPMPLRPLKDNEELFFLAPQVVSVRNKSLIPDPGRFTAEDRALLRQIAEKLDIR